MNIQRSSINTLERPDSRHGSETRLHGRWLLARLGWIVLVLFLLGVSIASLPTSFALLHQPCPPTVTQCYGYGIGFDTARDIPLPKLGISRDAYTWFWIAITCITALVLFGVGGLLFWHRSDDWMALLVALMCITIGATIVTNDLDVSSSLWSVLGQTVLLMESLAILFTLALFPNGRFVPHWALWVALVYPAYCVFYLGFLNQLHLPGWTLYNNAVNGVAWFGCWIILTGAQVYRYFRVSNVVERQQTKWVAFSFAALLVFGLVESFVASFLYQWNLLFYLIVDNGSFLFVLIIPFSIGIAILRYRLWDIDIIINRTLVYGALTASIVGIYILVVGYLGALFRTGSNLLISLIAAGLVAVLFQPLRELLQRAVNRLLYGQRDEPYTVITGLSQRLEATLAPGAVLPTIVETVAQALKLPYAAILLKQDDAFAIAASYGKEPGEGQARPFIAEMERHPQEMSCSISSSSTNERPSASCCSLHALPEKALHPPISAC